MSKFGPFPETDFYCPIKGDICESYGLAVYCQWKNETELIALRAQLEQARTENATLREVIDNIGGALDANQKKWFEMEAANAELRAALEAWVDFAAFYIDKKDWEGKEILRDSYLLCATATRKALASTGSEVLEELRRLRETEKVLYMIASALDAFNLQDLGLCPEWCACYLENPCGFQMELCARRKLFGFEAAEKWASGDEENEIPEKVGGTDATL
jgi:hypothetical protein